ncbi:MAG: hypothetical protein LUF00_09565 [Lachnospiraceae bacterium]|nr:hypothetical protein [Lachnospiraceae bacterium]
MRRRAGTAGRILWICIVTTLFAGCGLKETDATMTSETEIGSESPAESGAASDAETESTRETESPDIETAQIDRESLELLDGYENLYVLEEMMPDEGAYTDMASLGDYLLLIGEDYEAATGEILYYFCVYDPWEQEILASLNASQADATGYQAAADALLVYQYLNQTIRVYDETLTETAEIDLSEALGETWGCFYSGETLFPLYVSGDSEGEIWKLSAADSEPQQLSLPLGQATVAGVTADGEGLILSGVNKDSLQYETILWDTRGTETEAAAETPPYGSFYGSVCDRHILQQIDWEQGIWLDQVLGESARYLCVDMSAELSLLGEERILMRREELEGEDSYTYLTLYDGEGTFLSALSFYGGSYAEENYSYLGSSVYRLGETGWVALLCGDTEGKAAILLWDTEAVGGTEESLAFETTRPAEKESADSQSGETELAALYERAEEMGETCGIPIRIGDEVEPVIDVYQVAEMTDAAVLEEALDALEEILACYPEEFFQAFSYGSVTQAAICLGGALISEDESTVGQADGFVSEWNDELLLVLDVNLSYNWYYTVNHEISHLIDRRLAFRSNCVEEVLYSEEAWETLNPADFTYWGTYENYEANPDAGSYTEYFVDSYGMTFATEDRAEIFGRAMEGFMNGQTPEEVFAGQDAILEKLSFYAACIRDGFDDENWQERMPWEPG